MLYLFGIVHIANTGSPLQLLKTSHEKEQLLLLNCFILNLNVYALPQRQAPTTLSASAPLHIIPWTQTNKLPILLLFLILTVKLPWILLPPKNPDQSTRNGPASITKAFITIIGVYWNIERKTASAQFATVKSINSRRWKPNGNTSPLYKPKKPTVKRKKFSGWPVKKSKQAGKQETLERFFRWSWWASRY